MNMISEIGAAASDTAFLTEQADRISNQVVCAVDDANILLHAIQAEMERIRHTMKNVPLGEVAQQYLKEHLLQLDGLLSLQGRSLEDVAKLAEELEEAAIKTRRVI